MADARVDRRVTPPANPTYQIVEQNERCAVTLPHLPSPYKGEEKEGDHGHLAPVRVGRDTVCTAGLTPPRADLKIRTELHDANFSTIQQPAD